MRDGMKNEVLCPGPYVSAGRSVTIGSAVRRCSISQKWVTATWPAEYAETGASRWSSRYGSGPLPYSSSPSPGDAGGSSPWRPSC